MTGQDNAGLPDVEEPKVGPERIVHEKEERSFDVGAFKTLSLAGALCGTMMWAAFTVVGGEIDLVSLFGAIMGGLVSGWAIYALS
jgi:hypothetical protein